MAAVEELSGAGRTILFVTHDFNLVIRHAHRIVVMGGGRVQFDGTRVRHLLVPLAGWGMFPKKHAAGRRS